MIPIFCIVGKSGSGKSTYLDALMNDSRVKELYFKELKYHTTRSKRTPEEDAYYFTTMEEYEKDIQNVVEARFYKKYDEEVVYYTTKDDLNPIGCNGLICAASVDQALAYYDNIPNVYIINIEVDTKERLLRLINRCKTEAECYEVCRRTIEEDSEYSKLFERDFGNTNMINIDNNYNHIEDNISKIILFIKSKLYRII